MNDAGQSAHSKSDTTIPVTSMRRQARIQLTAAAQRRFHTLVDSSGEHPRGCWEWQGTFYDNGYGRFIDAGIEVGAHRAAFWIKHRRQPTALVLHGCDNRACCNPEHLFEGTHKDNIDDCIRKGRFRAGTNQTGRKLTPEQKQYVVNSTRTAKVAKRLAAELGCTKYNIWRIWRECPQQ